MTTKGLKSCSEPDTRPVAADGDLAGEPARGSTEDRAFSGSIQVRHVDAGSCNGCEIEIASSFAPVYDLERYGVRLVASPALISPPEASGAAPSIGTTRLRTLARFCMRLTTSWPT